MKIVFHCKGIRVGSHSNDKRWQKKEDIGLGGRGIDLNEWIDMAEEEKLGMVNEWVENKLKLTSKRVYVTDAYYEEVYE